MDPQNSPVTDQSGALDNEQEKLDDISGATAPGATAESVTADAAANAAATSPADTADDQIITWEASESVSREKNTLWFVILIAGALGLALLSIFVMKIWSFTALIVVMAVSVVMMAARPPRILHYQLSNRGLIINEKQYVFGDFKAFGVVQDGGIYHLTLLPIKRFLPPIDVYFPTEQGEAIVDMFGAHVPMKTIKPDVVDKITRQLRF